MMSGPALLNPQIAAYWAAPGIASAVTILNVQFRWIFAIIIIACLAEAGKGISRIIRNR
jgi:hypothetical protein